MSADQPTAGEVAHWLLSAALEASETLDRLWAAYWTAAKREGVEGDWRALVGPAAAFGDLRQMLGRLRGEADEEIGRGMQAEKDEEGHSLVSAVVEPVGFVQRHAKAQRTVWDVSGLKGAVTEVLTRRLLDDRHVMVDDDGVVLSAPEAVTNAVRSAIGEVVEACAMSPSASWKVGKLEQLGIDPKEYRAREYAGFTIQIVPGVGVAPQE